MVIACALQWDLQHGPDPSWENLRAVTVQDFLERYEVGETVGVGGRFYRWDNLRNYIASCVSPGPQASLW